ncbi:unnamed protein product [Miscanthus lutarioriparius]|uniref:Uncharacterized protein n=1 Tax=Miscanthus lutarioriparius TaxID=422564 RepID=A0A811RDB3_9POAL|nr:unnamed protein product [Miscanthus lutarioriparius]
MGVHSCTSTLSSSAFSSRPKRVRTPCSLNLINRTDGYANYWVIPQFPEIYSIDKLSFILGPMSTGTLNVTMGRELKDLVSCIGNEPEILKLVEELGEDVHSAIVAAVDCQPRERSSPPKTVSSVSFTSLGAIDVHPTKPWILAGGNNYLTIWDQNEEATVFALDVNEEGSTVPRLGIVAVIFIPRKQWFVTTDDAGYVQVYSCETWQRIKTFRVTSTSHSHSFVMSMAIHPIPTHTCYWRVLTACSSSGTGTRAGPVLKKFAHPLTVQP